jgi:hypothetical protein
MEPTAQHHLRGKRAVPRQVRQRLALAWLICPWAGLLLLSANVCRADTLRVTTWNLAHDSNVNEAGLLREAGSILRFTDPDVVLLQNVKDWHTCIELCELLQPAKYSVVVCSAFHGASSDAPAQPQVAILSKYRVYFTWTEAWPGTGPGHGGVAFAAVDAGTQRLGFFSSLLDDQFSGEKELGQVLLEAMDSVRHWETNQVQTFVFAASAGSQASNPARLLRRTSSSLEAGGLVDATESMAPEANSVARDLLGRRQPTAYAFFAGPQGFPFEPRVLASARFKNPPLTCEIELDPDKVSTDLDIRAENRRERQVRVEAARTKLLEAAAGVLGLGLLAGFVGRARRRKRARLRSGSVLPARTPAPVNPRPAGRPVIHVEAPAKARPPGRTGTRTLPPKPVLRLQKPARTYSSPETSEAESTSATHAESQLPSFSSPPSVAAEAASLPESLGAVDPAVRRGVIRELASWLKQKFVRKLLTDRDHLMQAQYLATRMATTLDTRLARIEAQIQVQNQAYLRRIEELNRELAAAREENRELIRERIAQVKAEMEAARQRVLAEANLNSGSLRL